MQKHRFGPRPGAFRTFGTAAQLFERKQQLLDLLRHVFQRVDAPVELARRCALTVRLALDLGPYLRAIRVGGARNVVGAVEAVASRVDAQQRIDRSGERQRSHRRGQAAVRVRAPRSRRFGRGSRSRNDFGTGVGHWMGRVRMSKPAARMVTRAFSRFGSSAGACAHPPLSHRADHRRIVGAGCHDGIAAQSCADSRLHDSPARHQQSGAT